MVQILETKAQESPPGEVPKTSNLPRVLPPFLHKQSTIWARKQYAVCVRHAHKSYGSKQIPMPVLQNLNMTVPKGTIYGLLGASGCGKTTLLSCIVGRRHLDSGEVWVLGGEPGTEGSGVPGNRVGYMPQEIALNQEFSIKETITYFGWIYGMAAADVKDKLDFLVTFLDLPNQNRLVKNLSGGQQRRVSFAVALMHDPELLILDEPTVGVDPLLRQSIWKHLLEITEDSTRTVIITTHYIEEAKQANTIGLMRSGKLLAEESPTALLNIFNSKSLEEVFLILSTQQGPVQNVENANLSDQVSLSSIKSKHEVCLPEEPGIVGLNFSQSKEVLSTENMNGHAEYCKLPSDRPKCRFIPRAGSRSKFKALLLKNFFKIWRNISIMLFIFAIPIMQVALFCLAIGRDPAGLKLGVVNHEQPFGNLTYQECSRQGGCTTHNQSCRYLDMLGNKTSMIQQFYPDVDSALDAVREGEIWGVLYFNENFTDCLFARGDLQRFSDNETLDGSEVVVWLDMSNSQIGVILQRVIQEIYRDFVQDYLRDCKINPGVGDIPLVFGDTIYGSNKPSFTDFVAPGTILAIIFFLPVSLTSSALIIERTEGLLDRSFVAGVTPGEILLSHVTAQFLVVCLQTALVLVSAISVFGIQCIGNMGLVILLVILQGLCGMCFGFLISAVCALERTAIHLALGSFYPTILLCGIIWPIESMPDFLRHFTVLLPMTLATRSLRSIFTRAWSLNEHEVYIGFLATICWIVIFLTSTYLVLRYKKRN